MKQIIIHRAFEKDMLHDLDKLRSMIRETLDPYGIRYVIPDAPYIMIDDIIRIDFYYGSVNKIDGLKPNYSNADTFDAGHYLTCIRGAVPLIGLDEILKVVKHEVKKSSLFMRCRSLLDAEKEMVIDFRKVDYVWQIGADNLNKLIRESGRYNSFDFIRTTPSTGLLLNIQYRIHPSNDCLKLVRKESLINKLKINSLYGHSTFGYVDTDTHCIVATRQERNKNMNFRIKPEERIKNVIFNTPYTIVFWDDGTKTVVKARGDDPYDPEKGLAMAIAKKFFGTNKNKSNYYDVFKKWLPEKKEIKKTINKRVDNCYYTVKELSVIFDISRDKVRNNIKNGLYPNAIKQSGAWLIPYNDFKKWLPEKEKKAKWKDPAEKVCSSCKHFTLNPSISPICPECMKDKTLPKWENAND